ncbi:TRAP transporter small permease [Aromatoleum evansii]|uniref:TRAP transporter small permease protein n=1 Tax=Aromatoleum evansii TaxID=59406 RepID=A0ABZ1AUK8_AROEV|nr:TRAP transporter small permease [Aromatoleum evansii]
MSSSEAPVSVVTKIVDGYFRFLKFVIALCLAIMVVLVFGNVFLRYAFNSGISVSEEVSRWFFVWMTFLGALVAMREHGHLGVDAFVMRLSPFGKRVCLILGQTLIAYVCWLLLVGSWDQTVINLDVKAPTSGWSMAWFYGTGIVFAVTGGLITLHNLYRALFCKLGEHELVQVKESEEIHGEHANTQGEPALRAVAGGKH